MIELLPYITKIIEQQELKYEVHSFESGCYIVDIWFQEKFYVLHIEKKFIGISLIKDEVVSFDNIPDNSFNDENSFKDAFKKIFLKA